MINQFSNDSCLLLIDVQKGVDVLSHWGGKTGRRNNPEAEENMLWDYCLSGDNVGYQLPGLCMILAKQPPH